ncbi:MAG: ACP S-malonyltransferase [Endomicrobium sp.]|jgi:[acyl-carrier-protein] S-malonyltransferase|nr:ACP S-malonyltransferase [Endomicrobium sp.]
MLKKEGTVLKIALMFPGQGSQIVGMGKDFYDRYPVAKEIMDLAGEGLKKIIFEGPDEVLKLTQHAQAAIFTVSMIIWEVFKKSFDCSKVEFVAAGHSLGEYSALCAAGFFGFQDGLSMVKARGKFIQKSSEKTPGLMVAILGLERTIVENICQQASVVGVCEAVNFNSPEQIVIAGTTPAINMAIELAEVAGATKIVILNVSGPFHSSLMVPASNDMDRELTKYNFSTPLFGVYTNCDALLTVDSSTIKEKLVKQIRSPVKWNESIQNVILADFDKFIEIGPGRVLSGLLRRIDRSKRALNIENFASLQKTLEELNR